MIKMVEINAKLRMWKSKCDIGAFFSSILQVFKYFLIVFGFFSFAAFPEHIPTKHQYKVLGNSLNVVVVAKLIQQLVS